MRKVYFLFSIIFVFQFLSAQPKKPTVPNITFKDISGIQHTLYDYLDQNRSIVLEFYREGNPITNSSREGMKLLHQQVGLGGNFTHVLFSLDLDTLANNEQAFKTSNAINYPIVSNLDPFKEIIQEYDDPFFLVICPDRVWKKRTNSIFNDTTYILSMTDACYPLSEESVDARVFSYFGENQYCDGELDAYFYIQNYSKATTITSASIKVTEDNFFRGRINWQGQLNPYEIDTVYFPVGGIGTYDILKFQIDTVNSQPDSLASNNSFIQEVREGKDLKDTIYIDITTDFYPHQTGWKVLDENGNIVFSSAGYMYQANTYYHQPVYLGNHSDGCYKVVIEDSLGDGILNGSTPDGTALGKLRVYTDQGDTIITENDFESSISARFFKLKNLSTSEISDDNNISLLPNSIVWQNPIKEDKIVKRYNLTGQLLEIIRLESGNTEMSTADWSSGIYLLDIQGNNQQNKVKYIKYN